MGKAHCAHIFYKILYPILKAAWIQTILLLSKQADLGQLCFLSTESLSSEMEVLEL